MKKSFTSILFLTLFISPLPLLAEDQLITDTQFISAPVSTVEKLDNTEIKQGGKDMTTIVMVAGEGIYINKSVTKQVSF